MWREWEMEHFWLLPSLIVLTQEEVRCLPKREKITKNKSKQNKNKRDSDNKKNFHYQSTKSYCYWTVIKLASFWDCKHMSNVGCYNLYFLQLLLWTTLYRKQSVDRSKPLKRVKGSTCKVFKKWHFQGVQALLEDLSPFTQEVKVVQWWQPYRRRRNIGRWFSRLLVNI